MLEGQGDDVKIDWEELRELEPRAEGQKAKKDFVKVNTTFAYFMEEFRRFYRSKFAYHHQQAKI